MLALGRRSWDKEAEALLGIGYYPVRAVLVCFYGGGWKRDEVE
jgi:hypothetical protein